MTTRLAYAYPNALDDIKLCAAIHKKHGKSYYLATKLLPEEERQATHALYAWMRIPDDWVDSPNLSLSEKAAKLAAWSSTWKQVLLGKPTEEPVLRLARHVFTHYHIPTQHSDAFLTAMQQDLTKKRYATYKELEQYMYGSAAVVGLMMGHIIGMENWAKEAATANGYAMQLTNFLRDIGEDLKQRDRIYIPREDLDRFEISEADIANQEVTEKFKALLKFEIQRADDLYEQAWLGMEGLAQHGQTAVRAASILYRQILRKIEQQQYDVFAKRAHTSRLEKIWLLLGILFKYGR